MSRHHLKVELHGEHIADLFMSEQDVVSMTFLESYIEQSPQPILGQHFLDNPPPKPSRNGVLPSWFANVLPEGLLRELVAQKSRIRNDHEFLLIAALGQDLPGAVRVTTDTPIEHSDLSAPLSTDSEAHDEGMLKFSLAGVQLKFSMLREGRGLTMPASGIGGDWIVKLPDHRYPRVPHNEWAMMTWARHAGIDVPEFELFPLEQIHGLSGGYLDNIPETEKHVFGIRRFDRPSPDARVHIEDFLQVVGERPSAHNRRAKYKATNYETVANIVHALTEGQDTREFILRLIFTIIIANADAHLKNWSLIYPDTLNARLSPAYDLVSTIHYIEDDSLALNLGKNKSWERVERAHLMRLARKIGLHEPLMATWITESIDAIMNAWHEHHLEWDLSIDMQARLRAHWKRVPLLSSTTTP